jgi:hypothetical protein
MLNRYLSAKYMFRNASTCFEENKILREDLDRKNAQVEELYDIITELDKKIQQYESAEEDSERTPLIEKKSCCVIL